MLLKEVASMLNRVWTLPQAEDFIGMLRRILDVAGLEAHIVGSTKTTGQSAKDLDIVLTPKPERKDDYDYEELLKTLMKLGDVQPTKWEGEDVDKLVLPNGKVVDFFFTETWNHQIGEKYESR